MNAKHSPIVQVNGWLAHAAISLCIAAAYFGLARFGLKFATINGSVSLVWPATGLSMAALMIFGKRHWAGIFAGAFALTQLRPDRQSLEVGLWIASGNAAEALLAAWVMGRWSRFGTPDERPVDFIRFCAYGAGLSTMVSAAAGVRAMELQGLDPGTTRTMVFSSWWMGNAIGALLVTPIALSLVQRSHVRWSRRMTVEGLLLAGLLCPLVYFSFCRESVFGVSNGPLAFVLFPFIIWTSVRFGSRGAALVTLLISIVAIHATAEGHGPFGALGFPANLAFLQLHLATLAATAYLLGYAAESRLRAVQGADMAWQHLQLHVERSPLGVIEWDRDFRVIGWNPAAEKIFGWKHTEAVGRHATFIIPEDERPRVNQIWSGLLTGSGGQRSTNENLTRAGRRVKCEWYNIPLAGQDGKVAGAVSLVEDVTQMKHAEAERQMLERKLQEAQKLESLGVLAGGIAHDFNNLLTGILGNASLARLDLPAGSPVEESLAQIEASAQRAAELCRQMLAYSGKGRFIIEAVDLNSVVNDTLSLIRLSITKRAELTCALAPNLPRVEGDATQIRQVVMNLVINASDALGENPGSIRIQTGLLRASRADLDAMQFGHALPEGAYVYLDVDDTGAGMDKEVLDRIFDPFFTTKFAGRGLGLAAVLGIVRGHKGAIMAASQPRQGAHFRILWPASHPGAVEAHDDTVECPEDWRAAGRVLVVDDEESVRQTVARMMESCGFQVDTARDGVEAVEKFERDGDAYALVLLDLTMPRMDGIHALERMKVLNPAVPVLLMSGYNEQDAVRRFSSSGLAGFIQKPFTIRALREKARMLARSGEVAGG